MRGHRRARHLVLLLPLGGCPREPPDPGAQTTTATDSETPTATALGTDATEGVSSAGSNTASTPPPGSSSDTGTTITGSSGVATGGSTTAGTVPCNGRDDITMGGTVSASSTFSGFSADLAIDADLSTSWFSDGPRGDDIPTAFTWTAPATVCVTEISIAGNGQHADAAFRTDFGFENVIVSVFDEADELVFEEAHDLAGTPDPDTVSLTGGVEGRRVELAFSGHEDPSAGGFAELQVLGSQR